MRSCGRTSSSPPTSAGHPRDVRYGDGQYLSDISPGTKTPAQLSRAPFGHPFLGRRGTHYVEIDVTGLNVQRGRPGVFVIPTVPYLTSLRMTSEELVQSIGISAFVCPLALTLALAVHGRYGGDVAGASLLALIPALIGMYVGQRLRRRLPAATFMRWFFIGLVALGGYMCVRALTR